MGRRNLTNYSGDPTHVHDSVQKCRVCWPIHRAEIHKRAYNKFAGDDARYGEYLKRAAKRKRLTYAKKKQVCRACGEPREPGKWYCNECIVAFRSWSQTANKAKRRKAGKDDPKVAYKRKVAKYGLKFLAEQHRAQDARRRARAQVRTAKNERRKEDHARQREREAA